MVAQVVEVYVHSCGFGLGPIPVHGTPEMQLTTRK